MILEKPVNEVGPLLSGVNNDDLRWPVLDTDGFPLDDLYRWYGSWHNHLENHYDHSGAFSPNDVRTLQLLGLIATAPGNPYAQQNISKPVVFVTTYAGTFALKIEDQQKLNNFNMARYLLESGPQGADKVDAYAEAYFLNPGCYNINCDATHDQTVIGMLRFIQDQDCGVSLYEVSNPDNLTGWKKLNLTENAGNYNFTETPCN